MEILHERQLYDLFPVLCQISLVLISRALRLEFCNADVALSDEMPTFGGRQELIDQEFMLAKQDNVHFLVSYL